MKLGDVESLVSIALNSNENDANRKHAVDALLDVLRHADDAFLRAGAAKAFEEGSGLIPTAESGPCTLWLKTQTKLSRSMRLIFVDDDAALLRVFGRCFSEHGWKEITLSEDSEEAIRLVQQLHPAIVITDLTRPKMSGAQMARVLRANPQTREIPILLLSGNLRRLSEDDRVLFAGILTKPCVLSTLMLAVEMTIAGKYPN